MRKFLLAFILLFVSQLTFAQKNFYYPAGTTIDEAGLAGGEFSTTLKFRKNQAGDPITFKWEVLSIDTNKLSSGASVDFGVCDNLSCYTSFVGAQFDMNPVNGAAEYGQFKLQAFQVTGDLKIVVKVRVWDKSNPATADTIDMSWRTDNWVGLNEYKGAPEVSVYPNPASTVLNVSYQLGSNGKANFELVSLVGKTVYRKELNTMGGNLSLNIEKLPKGVYFYSVKSNSGKVLVTKKLVIQ